MTPEYADQGIENIDSIQILIVPPIREFGTVTEIIKAFGSRKQYEKAIKELENELYKVASWQEHSHRFIFRLFLQLKAEKV